MILLVFPSVWTILFFSFIIHEGTKLPLLLFKNLDFFSNMNLRIKSLVSNRRSTLMKLLVILLLMKLLAQVNIYPNMFLGFTFAFYLCACLTVWNICLISQIIRKIGTVFMKNQRFVRDFWYWIRENKKNSRYYHLRNDASIALILFTVEIEFLIC